MYKARSVHAMRFATCNIEYKKRAVVPLYFYLYNVISVIIPILPLDLYVYHSIQLCGPTSCNVTVPTWANIPMPASRDS